jgi:heat shock protein HslJ
MNKVILAVFSLLLIFQYYSCKVIEVPINQSIYKEWMVTEFKNYKGDSIHEFQATIDFSDGETCVAQFGCNSITYSYKVTKSLEIKLEEEGSTAKICNEMQREEEFKKMMASVSELHLDDKKLFLINDEGENIVCQLKLP